MLKPREALLPLPLLSSELAFGGESAFALEYLDSGSSGALMGGARGFTGSFSNSLRSSLAAAPPARTRCAPRPGFFFLVVVTRLLVNAAAFLCNADGSLASSVGPPSLRPAISFGSSLGAGAVGGAAEEALLTSSSSTSSSLSGSGVTSFRSSPLVCDSIFGVGPRAIGAVNPEVAKGELLFSGVRARCGGAKPALFPVGGTAVLTAAAETREAGDGVLPREGGGVFSRIRSSRPLSPPS
mmetsp:Transcript_15554/g.30099  ORF Transcript_15554/g.30099 Transcript_15554/m.30099 type:complete len:240 (-) Transcript_15554:817-1536(-)